MAKEAIRFKRNSALSVAQGASKDANAVYFTNDSTYRAIVVNGIIYGVGSAMTSDALGLGKAEALTSTIGYTKIGIDSDGVLYSKDAAAAGDGAFQIKGDSDTTGTSVFTANQSSDSVVSFTGDSTYITTTASATGVSIAHKTSTVTTGTYGEAGSSNKYKYPVITVDAAGHITAASSNEIDLSGIVGSMVYKGTLGTGGTVTTLPNAEAANKGWVYVVSVAGTYAGKDAQVGDMFVSNGSNWDLIQGTVNVESKNKKIGQTLETIAVVEGVEIKANIDYYLNKFTISGSSTATTQPITAGQQSVSVGLTAGNEAKFSSVNKWLVIGAEKVNNSPDIKFAHALSGVTVGTYGQKRNNQNFDIPVITVDAAGHVTVASNETIEIPTPANPNNGQIHVKTVTNSTDGNAVTTATKIFSADQSGDMVLSTEGAMMIKAASVSAVTVGCYWDD